MEAGGAQEAFLVSRFRSDDGTTRGVVRSVDDKVDGIRSCREL